VGIWSTKARQKTIYEIHQVPEGASIRYRPNFRGSRPDNPGSQSQNPGSRDLAENSPKKVDNDTKTAQSGQKPAKKPEPEQRVSSGNPNKQEEIACCGDEIDRRKRAERLTSYIMQISQDKDKGWDRPPVFQIMLELCKTHSDEAISWVIQHVATRARTPGLIRKVVLQRPTTTAEREGKQRKADQERREQTEKARLRREAMKPSNIAMRKAMIAKIRQKHAASPGAVTNSGVLAKKREKIIIPDEVYARLEVIRQNNITFENKKAV